jgi:hypothetical protein
MPLVIKRQPDGRIMGRNEGGGELYLLSKSRRVANRKTFEIRHYMIPSTGTIVFALKNLSMSMLHRPDANTETTFGLATRSSGQAKPIYYEGKVFMVFPNIMHSESCVLVNDQSLILSGSNLFNNAPQLGLMCLGSALDPLTLNPIDALCFNSANRDLGWQGPSLTGAWERNPDPENPRSRANNQIFKISHWPTWSSLQTPLPQQVLDATRDW